MKLNINVGEYWRSENGLRTVKIVFITDKPTELTILADIIIDPNPKIVRLLRSYSRSGIIHDTEILKGYNLKSKLNENESTILDL